MRRLTIRRTAATPQLQLAVFTVGSLDYALDIMIIKQIIRPVPVRPVPRAPKFVEGVFELRGSVIPVIDLRRRFGLPVPEPSRANKFIIVSRKGRLIGLVVDAVQHVLRVSNKEVSPAPDMLVGAQSRVFTGVCRRDDQLVLVVDLEALLSSDEELHLQDMALEAGGGQR